MKANRFNICMYTPSASGGHARYTHHVLSALSEQGRDDVQVSLITSRDLDPKYRTRLYPIYDILPPLRARSAFRSTLGWGYSRLMHYRRRETTFLRWIEDHDNACDGIHFQEYSFWLAPRHFRWLKARGKRLFFTVHNIYLDTYTLGNLSRVADPLLLHWFRTALRLCDVLFVHSEKLLRQLARFLGPGHPPIFVTPHGVWKIAGDNPTASSPEERLRRRHLLFFGVIRPTKGLHILLDAMEDLVDCTLTVAGQLDDVRYREQIQAVVERLPVGRVELVDRFVEDDEMVQLFDRSSLVVLPYTSFSAQSGVLHDALAHGLPVVATDVGTLGESVRSWGIGQVVPPNDDAALAAAIHQMLTPHRYLQASGAVGRVRENLSWNRLAKIVIEAYRSVWRDGSKATAV
jgi:glycosyltransferase involved in cell wall biosynthesis